MDAAYRGFSQLIKARSRSPTDREAFSRPLLSWDLWFLGYPERSLSRVSEALALAQDLGHPYTIAFGGQGSLMRRALLEPICRWFDEGAGTADLRRARAAQSGLH